MKSFDEVLSRVIDDGITAARMHYTAEYQSPMLEGSIAGFEACRRHRSPVELAGLLERARAETGERRRAVDVDVDNYWCARYYEMEVEWVCNVMSAALANSGLPTIVPPTGRGIMKAAEILGVAQPDESAPS